MGCGCKNVSKEANKENFGSNLTNKKNVVNFILKLLTMALVLISMPIIMLAVLWITFKIIMLNKEVEILPLLKLIGGKLTKKEDDDDDDDDDLKNLTEDDVVLLDAEDITNKYK